MPSIRVPKGRRGDEHKIAFSEHLVTCKCGMVIESERELNREDFKLIFRAHFFDTDVVMGTDDPEVLRE